MLICTVDQVCFAGHILMPKTGWCQCSEQQLTLLNSKLRAIHHRCLCKSNISTEHSHTQHHRTQSHATPQNTVTRGTTEHSHTRHHGTQSHATPRNTVTRSTTVQFNYATCFDLIQAIIMDLLFKKLFSQNFELKWRCLILTL